MLSYFPRIKSQMLIHVLRPNMPDILQNVFSCIGRHLCCKKPEENEYYIPSNSVTHYEAVLCSVLSLESS